MAVYLIEAAGTGRIKIGATQNITSRVRALRTGCPGKIEVLFLVDGGQKEERALHRKFKSLRVDGTREWFHDNEVIRQCFSNGIKDCFVFHEEVDNTIQEESCDAVKAKTKEEIREMIESNLPPWVRVAECGADSGGGYWSTHRYLPRLHGDVGEEFIRREVLAECHELREIFRSAGAE